MRLARLLRRVPRPVRLLLLVGVGLLRGRLRLVALRVLRARVPDLLLLLVIHDGWQVP